MSAFGDGTPKQEIHEAILNVRADYGLGIKEIIKILAEIIAYWIDYQD